MFIKKLERVFKISLLILVMSYQPLFGKEQKCQSFEETIKSYIPQPILDATNLVSELIYGQKKQEKTLKSKDEKKLSQKNFEELEKSVGVMKDKYEDTYWVVSGISEYLELIKMNVNNWYGATTKSTQNKAIKNLKEARVFAVVDFLKNPKNKKYTKYLPKKMQNILQSKMNKDSIESVSEYMRQIKSLEKTFQKNKVFSNMKKLNEQFAAGKERFKNVESLINFTKTFNPNGINKPTDRLRKISGVLKYANTMTQSIPLIGTLIDCYARITEEFADALDKLDQNIQKSRVGSLGGKLDTSSSPQACLIALRPENEILTYMSEDYTNIAPYKVFESFEAHHIFLTKQDGSQCFHFEKGVSFSKIYNGYLYLLQQGKKVSVSDFIKKVSVFSDTNGGIKFYQKQKNRANEIYKMIPTNGFYRNSFYRLLEKSNQYRHNRLYSLEDRKLPNYKHFDEFFAYWIFDNHFRHDVQTLVNKYRDKEFVEGRITFGDINNKDTSRPKNSKVYIDNKLITLNHDRSHTYSFETILTSKKEYTYRIEKNKGWVLSNKEKIKHLNTDKNGKDKPFYTYVSLRFIEKGKSSVDPKESTFEDKSKKTEISKEETENKKIKSKPINEEDNTQNIDKIREKKLDFDKLARQKWDWFKKDVPKYLNKLFAKSEGEYGILERRVHQLISEKKGTQEEADRCLKNAKKAAKALRKSIGKAKKEHPQVLRKMHDDQGNPNKILAHIKDFVSKYEIPEDLKISVSYSSPCLDASDDKATAELKVSISGSKSYSIESTETVTLKAMISGGKAPVDIQWEGGNISPSGSTAIFAATTPGTYSVQVTGKDASGQSKSDAVRITVKAITMPKLSGLPNEVYYGTSKVIFVEGIQVDLPDDTSEESSDRGVNCPGPFCVSTDTSSVRNPFAENARVKISQDSDGSHVGTLIPPADDREDLGAAEVSEEEEGEYEYVWISSEKGIEFNPPSGKEPQVKVTFGNIGNVEIWAEVHKNGELLGETERIQTKVIPPKFTLKVKPETLYIGDEGKVTITLDPDIHDKFTDFNWLPMGKNAQKLIESGNGRSTTFKLRSIKPATIEVLVRAKSPYYGDEIGSVKYVVSAKPYKVSVSKPKRLDKAPWKWDIKLGKAVDLPQAIAVFQDAEVHCKITPTPKEKVRYQWTVDKEGCSISAPGSKSTNLNAHETGTYTVLVTVSDKNGIELGKSSTTFTVNVSQRDIDVAKKKAEKQKKVQELLLEGRKLWKEGKLHQAIAKVAQAQKNVGEDKEVSKTLKAMQKQKKDIDTKLKEAEILITKGQFKEVEKTLSGAANISNKYKKYIEVLKHLSDAKKKAEKKKKQIAKLLKDAKALKDTGKLDEAASILKKGTKQLPDSKEINKLLKEVQKQQDDARGKMTEGQAQWKNGMLDNAVQILKEAVKIDPSNKQVAKVLKGMLGQKKIMDDALKKANKLIAQKKFKQAKNVLNKVVRVSNKYPVYTDMLKKLNLAKKKVEEEKRIAVERLKAEKLKKKSDEALARQKALQEEADRIKEEERAEVAKLKQDKIDKAIKKANEKEKNVHSGQDSPSSVVNRTNTKPNEKDRSYAQGFAGKWKSNYGVMKFSISGIRATGHYTHDKGRIEAVLSQDGKVMKGTWAEAPSYKGSRDAGKMHFTLSSDGTKINGLWSYGDNAPTKSWTATRIGKVKSNTVTTPISKDKVSSSTTVQAKYVGCYKEKGHKEKVVPSMQSRDINMHTFKSNQMTMKLCTEFCGNKGLKYASMQYANQCFCDDSYGQYGKADNCNMPCTGNKNEICGGAWANSVYALTGTKDVEDSTLNTSKNILSLVGSWKFGRSKHYGKPVQKHLCNLTLTDELVEGIGYKIKSCHTNESYWILEGKILLFVALDGTITTRFTEVKPNYWEGTYVGSAHSGEGVVHYLKKSDDKTDTTNKLNGTSNIVGKTKTSTSYAPNSKGDVFKGGHWAGSSGGSDWIQKDFSSPQFVTGVSIGRASTDVTTKGLRLVLKLRKPSGKWITIDELSDTNINRTVLSGGAIGKSIPSYSKKLSPAIKATSFRLEFKGHGWFDATDIRIYTQTHASVLDTTGIDGIEEIGSISKDDEEALGAIAKKLKEGIRKGREQMQRAEEEAKKAALIEKIKQIREEVGKETIGAQRKSEYTINTGKTIKNKTGLTPVKIKLATTKKSHSSSDGTITSYITLSFWNVGAKVSGYDRAVLDIKSVASNGKVQNFHYVGTFEGGPNGDMVLSDKGMTVHISVIGGETVTFDGEGVRIKIPNPSVFKKN